jgi:2-keto-4-pentenoate hydratase/2-oxohepta-3-ene-1,7-dioic acid hydratase in catechol pathway
VKVLTYESNGRLSVGIVTQEGILDFNRAYKAYKAVQGAKAKSIPQTILGMLTEGVFAEKLFAETLAFVDRYGLVSAFTAEDPSLRAPILYPGKILALGLNYAAHAAEGGHKVPADPIYFVKASTSVIGPDEPVVHHRSLTRVDHEVELAVVIGKRCFQATEETAMDFVAAYTVLNDVTARDMQSADIKASHPWFRSKSLDTFCPMGPHLVLPEEINDPHSLDLQMKVNGEVRQHASTSDLIFSIPAIIAHMSEMMTLEPGDVISTGTPEGISAVHPGDVMEATVEGVGTLRNPVVAG